MLTCNNNKRRNVNYPFGDSRE